MLNPEAVVGSDRVKESPVGAEAYSSLNLIRIQIKETAVLKARGQIRHRDSQIDRQIYIMKKSQIQEP